MLILRYEAHTIFEPISDFFPRNVSCYYTRHQETSCRQINVIENHKSEIAQMEKSNYYLLEEDGSLS